VDVKGPNHLGIEMLGGIRSGGSIRERAFFTLSWIGRSAPRGSWISRALVLPFRVMSFIRWL